MAAQGRTQPLIGRRAAFFDAIAGPFIVFFRTHGAQRAV